MNKEQKLGDTYFNVDLLIHEDSKDWVTQVKGDNTNLYCKVCHKSCRLSNMDISAWKKHMEGQTHKNNFVKVKNIFLLLATASSSSSVIPTVIGYNWHSMEMQHIWKCSKNLFILQIHCLKGN